MKIGMNMLLWTGDLNDSHLPVLEELKEMGYDGVEIPMFDLNPEKFAKWGKRLDDLGLERTAVTARSAEENPISPDASVRAKGVAANCRALDCCQAAGATIMAGPFHSALGHFTGKGPTEDEWKWGVEGMRKVAAHAKKCDVTLAVESLNRFECYLLNCVADTVRFVRDVEHESCRMMYDTFHAHIEEKDVEAAIHECEDFLVHVHISENDRSTPGEGNVRWGRNFDTLADIGYDGWLTVEAFGLALPELAAATKIWRRMYDTEEKLARDALKFIKRQWKKRN
ncbi:MAG: sugar phosphate isomerase/epimerase [Planctomycetia bacterium]|nr:sugar phosphate isomerase/epimerase [Planctomycetia bacterium]